MSEFEKLTIPELTAKIKSLKSELFNLRFQLAINQLENPMRIKMVKKDIARAQTAIREKELKIAEESAETLHSDKKQ